MSGEDVTLGFLLCCLLWNPARCATTLSIPDDNSELLGMREYLYVTENKGWNEAQEVCRNTFQGFLATVNSQTVLNLFDSYMRNEWSSKANNTWIGLHRSDLGRPLTWDDPSCQPGNFSAFNPFKDSVQQDGTGGEYCYIYLKGPPGKFERAACDGGKPFICESLRTGCSFERLPAGMLWVPESQASDSVCKSKCDLLQGCLLTSVFGQSCVFLAVPPPGSTYVSYKRTCNSIGTLKDTSYSTSSSSSTTPTACQIRQPGNAVLTVAELTTNASSISFNCPTTAAPATCPSVPTPAPCSSEVITVTAVSEIYVPCSTSTVVSSCTYAVTTTVTDVISHPLVTATVTQTESVVVSLCDLTTPTSRATPKTSECGDTSVTVTTTISPIVVTTTVSHFVMQSVEQPVTIVSYVTITATVKESVFVVDSTETVTSPTVSPGVGATPHALISPSTTAPGATLPVDAATSASVTEHSSSSLSSTWPPNAEVVCQTAGASPISPDEVQLLAKSLHDELEVPKDTLSRTIRTKTSALDPRLSSKVLGYGSLVLVIIPFVLIFIADVPKIYRDVRRLNKAKEESKE